MARTAEKIITHQARAFGYLETSVKAALDALSLLEESYRTPPPEPLVRLRAALAADLKRARAIFEGRS